MIKRYPIPANGQCPTQWKEYHFPSLFVAKFEKGEFLYTEGHPIENLFLIESGKVKVCLTSTEGKSLLINFYSKGHLLGDVETVLSQTEAVTSIQAVTKVICYAVPVEEFLQAACQNPDLMRHIAAVLAERAKRSVRNASINILSNLKMRLCAYIEQTQRDGFFKDNFLALSDLLGVSYRHLHRTLQTLCQEGILQKAGRGYFIKDMETLSLAANGMYRM